MKALNFPLELQLVNVMNKLTQASLNISSKIHAPYVYQVVLVLALAPRCPCWPRCPPDSSASSSPHSASSTMIGCRIYANQNVIIDDFKVGRKSPRGTIGKSILRPAPGDHLLRVLN